MPLFLMFDASLYGLGLAGTGGLAILGGIVVGPILALGGLLLSAKAQAELDQANSNLKKAQEESLKFDEAGVKVMHILARGTILYDLLGTLKGHMNSFRFKLSKAVETVRWRRNTLGRSSLVGHAKAGSSARETQDHPDTDRW